MREGGSHQGQQFQNDLSELAGDVAATEGERREKSLAVTGLLVAGCVGFN